MENKKKIKTYEDLIVWEKADKLALDVFILVKKFPKEELYCLVSQIKRSALSVPANIAEGFSRGTQKEFVRFLYIALASLIETEYYIKFSFKMKYINEDEFNKNIIKTQEIGRMLNGLIRTIKSKLSGN